MTSIGKPSAASACGRNVAAFFATRNVLVATARTADGCRPDSRSRKRVRQASAARARRGRQAPLFVHARAEANRFAPGVETEDLVAFDAAHLEPEAVRSQVHDGERRGCRRRLCGGRFLPAAWAGEWRSERHAKPSRKRASRADAMAQTGRRFPPARSILLVSQGCAFRLFNARHAHRLPAEDPDRQGLRRRDRIAARSCAYAVAAPATIASC